MAAGSRVAVAVAWRAVRLVCSVELAVSPVVRAAEAAEAPVAIALAALAVAPVAAQVAAEAMITPQCCRMSARGRANT